MRLAFCWPRRKIIQGAPPVFSSIVIYWAYPAMGCSSLYSKQLLQTLRTAYVHLFPVPLSATSFWLLEICIDGNIYTMDTGNHYKVEFSLPLASWLLHVCWHAHIARAGHGASHWRGINMWVRYVPVPMDLIIWHQEWMMMMMISTY